MTTLFETKAEFANILSESGVTVIQSPKAKTACFNVKTRVMTLPILTDMREETYNGFVIHEIGHALYTTEEIMKLSIKYGHGSVGVLEDVRANNLMKRDFGGATPIFRKHYDILSKIGFFGKRSEFEKFNVLDKINTLNKTRFKGDGFPEIVSLWDEIKDIETPEELENAIIKVKDYIAAENEKNSEPEQEDTDHNDSEPDPDAEYDYDPDAEPSNDEDENDSESDEGDTESGDEENGEDSDDTESGDSEPSDEDSEDDENDEDSGSGASSDDDLDDEETEDSESGSDEDGDIEGDEKDGEDSKDSPEDADNGDADQTDSEASEADEERDFDKEAEEELSELESEIEKRIDAEFSGDVDTDAKTFFIPKKYDLSDTIIKSNEISTSFIDSEANDNAFAAFEKEIRPIVKQMVSAYNRNKSATSFRRKKVTRTGALDLKKLHLYKTSEDIFKRVSNTAKGKNHGVLFMLDMSGSMSGKNGILAAEQLIIMSDFCKAINVPFKVMGFWSYFERYNSRNYEAMLEVAPFTLAPSEDFKLVELLSNKQDRSTFTDFRKCLYLMAQDYRVNFVEKSTTKQIKYNGGTHLHNTAIVAPQLVEEFKIENAVEICNYILFADGGNSFSPEAYENVNEHNAKLKFEVDFSRLGYTETSVIDQKTGKKITFKPSFSSGEVNTISKLMELVRARTGANTMFMYLVGEAAYAKHNIDSYNSMADLETILTWEQTNELKKEIKAEKFVEMPNEDRPTKIIFLTTDMMFRNTHSAKVIDRSKYKSKGAAMTAMGKEWIKAQTDQKSKIVFAKLVAENISKSL